MKLICDADQCAYRDAITGACLFTGEIKTWDFCEFEMEEWPCFESVMWQSDYKAEFWIACRVNKSGIEFREKKFGKRCEANGIEFYVNQALPEFERWPEAKEIQCTEARTGYAFPLTRLFDPIGLATISKVASEKRPVMDLPTYDEIREAATCE